MKPAKSNANKIPKHTRALQDIANEWEKKHTQKNNNKTKVVKTENTRYRLPNSLYTIIG